MIREFTISVSEEELQDLYTRLQTSKFPILTTKTSENGITSKKLAELLTYWLEEYDWREQESQLNRYNHFKTEIAGSSVHFIHQKTTADVSIPLLLSHGWPDSFLRYIKVIDQLTEPRPWKNQQTIGFDVVIPSVIGFGYSTYPAEGSSINNETIADSWVELMTQQLGYEKFIAAGGDVGSGISRYIAKNHPDSLLGLYVNDVGLIRELFSPSEDLDSEEVAYQQTVTKWMNEEAGYIGIQSTKPATLAFGLSDSPIGLAAWLFEKFIDWSDESAEMTKDDILTNIMIYWFTNSISTSIQIYRENSLALSKIDYLTVPTGVALFPQDINLPPKKWVSKHVNLIHWNIAQKGGHFTALENPNEFSADLYEFLFKLLLK